MNNKSLEFAKLILAIRIMANHRDNVNNSLTHLHLQKIMWFCYIENFKLGNKIPLVDEEFEAWGYGPVLVSVYEEYKKYSGSNINDYFTFEEVKKWSLNFDNTKFKLIVKVFDDLDGKPAHALVTKSHDNFWYKYNQQNGTIMPLQEVIAFYGK